LTWESLRNGRLTQGAEPSVANQFASTNLIPTLGYNVYNVPNNQVVGTDGLLNPNAVKQFRWN